MGRELAADYPAAKKTFQEADQILDFELSRIAWHGPQEALDDTLNTQPALMVHSYAYTGRINERGRRENSRWYGGDPGSIDRSP